MKKNAYKYDNVWKIYLISTTKYNICAITFLLIWYSNNEIEHVKVLIPNLVSFPSTPFVMENTETFNWKYFNKINF